MPKVAYVKLSYELLEEIELEDDTTVGETKVKVLDHMQQITKFAANDLLDATHMDYYPAYNNTKKLSDLPIDPIILFWPKKDTHQRVNNLARAAIERFSRDTLVARARANAIEMIYEEIRGRISNLRSQMAKLAPRENTKSRSGSEATKHDNELLASPNEEFCARNEQLLGRIEQIDKDKFYLKGECASSEKNILLLGENVRSASFPVGLVTIMIRALML